MSGGPGRLPQEQKTLGRGVLALGGSCLFASMETGMWIYLDTLVCVLSGGEVI